MTNKELAAQCLIEAANLLEGIQADEYKARKVNEKVEQDRKDRENALMRQVRKYGTMTYRDGEKHYNDVVDARQKYTNEKGLTPDKLDSDRKAADKINAHNAATRRAEKDLKKINNESIDVASFLREAADLLDEAAATDERKAMEKEIKSFEKDDNMEKYLKGKMDKKEGKDFYKKAMNEIRKIEDAIDKIPEDTSGERFAIFMKRVLWAFISSCFKTFFLRLIGTRSSVITIPSLYVSKNWDRTYARSLCNQIREKIINTNDKYYS